MEEVDSKKPTRQRGLIHLRGNREMHKDSTSKTQRGKILERLIQAGEAGVKSYELAGMALQYGSRLKELRALGHNIVSQVKTVNGQKHGTFRLIKDVPAVSSVAHTAVMFSQPLVARMD